MDYAQMNQHHHHQHNVPASRLTTTSSINESPIYVNNNRETKLYIIINSETPIYMKVPISPESMTLAQVKSVLSLQYGNHKYYFKSHDPEFGEVKEEISDDNSKLPYEFNKIVVWIISSDNNNQDALFTMSTPSPNNNHLTTNLRQNNPSVQSSSSIPDPFNDSINHLSHNNTNNTNTNYTNNGRGTFSLPRSITPRSLYYSNHFETPSPISRSVYDSATSIQMRPLDVASLHCTKDHTQRIYSALKANSDSLDIRDREWLKMVIENAFIGSSLVKWLSANVYGFNHKKDIKRYANRMLSLGFIEDPMGSGTFSEKCYYRLS